MDGADLELRDAGVAFEALHLAPRLAAGGPGVGDSDSESSSSDSSGADSSGDSSDEDEAGGLDLLSPLPPGKGTDHPSAPPYSCHNPLRSELGWPRADVIARLLPVIKPTLSCKPILNLPVNLP